ncbi:MAG: tetratricopeptide repeat protein [Myxococcota bacterium]|nr:tetratricopeptide repeat protein [Myxococcota bacterium]
MPNSNTRQWGLRFAGLGLGVLLLAGVELALRAGGITNASVWEPPRLVSVVREGKIQGEFEFEFGSHFEESGEGENRQVRTASGYRLSPGEGYPGNGGMRDISFGAEPDPEVRRFVLLGGSAALGQAPSLRGQHDWVAKNLPGGPGALDESLAISGQLEQLLAKRGEKAEVINAGMIAQDSGSVRLIANEALAFKPEALLLYMGNNEGIGLAYAMRGTEIPVIQEFRGALRNLRLYRVIAEALIPKIRESQSIDTGRDANQRTQYENRVLGDVVLAQWASAGQPLIEAGQPTDAPLSALQTRFKTNLAHIVRDAKAVGVDVYVVPTPPHLPQPPFFSGHAPTLSNSRMKKVERSVVEALESTRDNQPERAVNAAQRAIEIDPSHASAHHALGMALGRLGDHDGAVDALTQALYLDLSRKRTLPDYGRIAHELCEELGCTTADAHHLLSERARKEGLGVYETMLGDHEHLNPAGNTWIAGVFESLIPAQ